MGRICFCIIRSLIIIENLIVATLASLLIYISFSAMDQDFGMDTLNDSHPKSVHAYISAISAGVGIIIALLSLLGLFGSIKKSKTALSIYGAIIFFMISMLAILAVVTLTMKSSGVAYRDFDKSVVNLTMSNYGSPDSEDTKTRVIMDYMQRKLSCCGVNSPNDWKEYGPTRKISKTCCSNPVVTNEATFKHCEQSEFKNGCWRALTDYFHANLSTARIILYFIIGFGLVCSMASFFMVRTLKRSLEVV